jgi:hypothetical protein
MRAEEIAKIARIAKIAEIETRILPQIYADDRRSEMFKNLPLINADDTDQHGKPENRDIGKRTYHGGAEKIG